MKRRQQADPPMLAPTPRAGRRADGAPRGLALVVAVALPAISAVWILKGEAQVGVVGVAISASVLALSGVTLGLLVGAWRRALARSRRYFELSRDLLCTANFDGYFEWVNPAWEETLGYTQAELLSQPFVEFVHPDERDDTEGETERRSITSAS